MKVAYYPGCSLHATGRGYDESVRAVAGPLGLELQELEDWNCCGATAYMNVNELLAFSMTARNLVLAQKTGLPLCAPCSACYCNLRKTEKYLGEFPEVKRKVDLALAEGGLRYDGGVVTKHALQVIVEDVGLEKVRSLVKRPLKGLKVAPYYGCQIARPYGIEDDPDSPTMMDRLLEALGATVVPFQMKTTCCGGSLMGTQEDLALRLCRNLLSCAEQNGANVMAVACPLCQTNVDVYQGRINGAYGTSYRIPVVYFTQLAGLAFGLDPEAVGLQRGAVDASGIAATA